MRTPFIAGNWKMNMTASEAAAFAGELKEAVKDVTSVELGVCPVSIALKSVCDVLADSNIGVGCQNMSWEDNGAFTGEGTFIPLPKMAVEHARRGSSDETVRVVFGGKTIENRLTLAGTPGTLVTVGDGLGISVNDRVPLAMFTRRGRSMRFVTMLEPFLAGQTPPQVDLQVSENDGTATIMILRVRVTLKSR